MPGGYTCSVLFCVSPKDGYRRWQFNFVTLRLYVYTNATYPISQQIVLLHRQSALHMIAPRIVCSYLFFFFKSTFSIHSETYNNVTYALARHASILSPVSQSSPPFHITSITTLPHPTPLLPRPTWRAGETCHPIVSASCMYE